MIKNAITKIKQFFREKSNKPLRDNEVYLGEKRVEVPKLTPTTLKKVFEKMDVLPGLILQVVRAPKENIYMYALNALEIALDEVVDITAITTGMDKEYLRKHVGVDEFIEFFMKLIKINNFSKVFQKVKDLFKVKGAEQGGTGTNNG